MPFGINCFSTFNFGFGNDSDFTIFDTYILYGIKIGFGIHNPAV